MLSKTNERGLNLDLTRDNYFMPKEIFNHSELTILHARLLLVLSTKKGLSLSNMDYSIKMWICIKPNKVKELKSMEVDLIDLGLIQANGEGLDFKKSKSKYIIYKDIRIVERCKTIRQLFFISIPYWWNKGNTVILSTSMFYGMFKGDKRRINEAWKNLAKTIGYKYSWCEKHNKIYINSENVADNCIIQGGIEQGVFKQAPKKEVVIFPSKILSEVSTSYYDELPLPPDYIPEFDYEMWEEPKKEASLQDLEKLTK